MGKYDKKIEKAKSILEEAEEELLLILWEDDPNAYLNCRLLLPMLEEGYEYDIKKLKLKKADELYYLKKLSDKFGQYSENIPRLKNTENELKKMEK